MNRTEAPEICTLVLVKGQEKYIWLYNPGGEREVLRSLGRLAANDEVAFTWNDAAKLSQRLKAV